MAHAQARKTRTSPMPTRRRQRRARCCAPIENTHRPMRLIKRAQGYEAELPLAVISGGDGRALWADLTSLAGLWPISQRRSGDFDRQPSLRYSWTG